MPLTAEFVRLVRLAVRDSRWDDLLILHIGVGRGPPLSVEEIAILEARLGEVFCRSRAAASVFAVRRTDRGGELWTRGI